MEQHLGRAFQAVMQLSAAIDQYAAALDSLKALSSYYGSNEKKASFPFALCLLNRTFASDFYKTTNDTGKADFANEAREGNIQGDAVG